MASAILAMRYPTEFAIIDINVITAINEEEPRIEKEVRGKDYLMDSKIYEKYLTYLKRMANKEEKKLRELELELFLKGRKIRKKGNEN